MMPMPVCSTPWWTPPSAAAVTWQLLRSPLRAQDICRSVERVGFQPKLAHTAAYWLMLTVRDAIPKARELATAEFATLRLRLLKIAARVVETTSRIRLAFAAACPEADLFRSLPGALLPLGPSGGACAPFAPTHPSSALQRTGRQAVKSRTQSCALRQRRSAAASIGLNNRTLTNRTGYWFSVGGDTAG